MSRYICSECHAAFDTPYTISESLEYCGTIVTRKETLADICPRCHSNSKHPDEKFCQKCSEELISKAETFFKSLTSQEFNFILERVGG